MFREWVNWVLLAFVIALFALMVLCRCASHDEEPVDDTDYRFTELYAQKERWCNALTDNMIEKRCDRGTFANLAGAFCKTSPFDLSRHEWEPGEHHRDIYPNKCFPENSKTEISADYFITRAHWWITSGDFEELDRTLKYLDDNVWIAGEGPVEITYILHLKPLLLAVKEHLTKKAGLGDFAGVGSLISFNDYLLAFHTFAKARMNGFISDVELAMYKSQFETAPESPIFCAFVHRFTDGDYSECMDILEKDFPEDEGIPLDDGVYGWGSLPAVIAFIASVGIME